MLADLATMNGGPAALPMGSFLFFHNLGHSSIVICDVIYERVDARI
jgi:hypothetical protein